MRLPHARPVAAPRPVARVITDARRARIEHDVRTGREEVPFALDGLRSKSVLEQVPSTAMPAVHTPGEFAVQYLHRVGDLILPRLNEKVIVVGHQAVRKDQPIVFARYVGDELDPATTLEVVSDDGLLEVTARSDVVVGAFFEVSRQSHESTVDGLNDRLQRTCTFGTKSLQIRDSCLTPGPGRYDRVL